MNYKNIIWIIFFTGLVLEIALSFNYWVGGDQLHLLELGSKLVYEGDLQAFSKLKAGGGTNLGILMQLLVALPIFIYPSYLSPMTIVILLNVASFFILKNLFLRHFSSKFFIVFSIFWWLSPVRLYNTGFLWEPAFLYLFIAVHLYSSYEIYKSKSNLFSFIHILNLFLILQIHNSAIILFIATILLLIFKKIKLSPLGAIAGFFTGVLFFLPLFYYLINSSPEFSESSGYIGKSILEIAPFLKGIYYSLKSGGFDVVKNLKESTYDNSLIDVLKFPLYLISAISVLFSIISVFWLIKIKYRTKAINELPDTTKWFLNYSFLVLISLTVASALSPITLQGWMVLPAHVGGVIILTQYLMKNYEKFRLKKVLPLIIIFQIFIMIYILFGQEKFNRDQKYPDDPVIQEKTYLKELF